MSEAGAGRPISVLLVEDSEDDAALILRTLGKSGFDVSSERVETAPDLAEALSRREWDIVLSDYSMPSLTGLDALSIMRESGRKTPVIIVSGAVGEELAVELMRCGAHDCIMKDKLSRIPPAVERELGESRTRREREEALESLRHEVNLNATLADLARNLIALPADIESVGGLVLRFSRELTGSKFGSVSLVDSRTGLMIPIAVRESEAPPAERLSAAVMSGDSVVGQIAIADPGRDYTARDQTAIERLADLFSIAVANHWTWLEKEQLSMQLRQMQKVEAIGTLAGGIAHDFNNILSPMIGYAEMVQASLPKHTRVWEQQDQVLKACSRARDLVGQILTLSRQTDEERKPTRLDTVLREALRLLRASLPATIEIRVDIDPRCGAVLAVPTQIHQVVMNLCTNAFHAMREKGGVLDVSLRPLNLDASRGVASYAPADYVRLEVGDTGHGMDRETIEKIFDPYFTTGKQGEGTGLGLSIVESIVRKHGGTIDVRSEPGQGSTFRVDLPAVAAGACPVEAMPAKAVSLAGKERILVVDDVVEIVDMAKEMLEGLGYEVTGFTSGALALESFAVDPSRYDLVITDLTMPNMTGVELAGRLLAIRPGLPIILCSGMSEYMNEKAIAPLGISRFLKKPILLNEYGRAVRQLLDEAQGAPGPA